MNKQSRDMLVTFTYQAKWGSGSKGGIPATRDDDLETLKFHLAKHIPGATFVRADCYSLDGDFLFSYSDSEAEIVEPIQASLLELANWEHRAEAIAEVYKKRVNKTGSVYVSFLPDATYVRISIMDERSMDVSHIKTMGQLNDLIRLLGTDKANDD
jgi:hypothetical protein